jgi:hypothetical protein
MPNYQCRECNANIDPTEQVSCPSCKTKKPLLCSKCNEPINHHDIFGIEKLRTKRPLLCKSCGHDNEVVKCPICKLSQVRSQGVAISEVEGANVYHKACLEKRREVIKMAGYAAPASAIGIFVIGLLMRGNNNAAFLGCMITAGILFVAINMYKTIIEPR